MTHEQSLETDLLIIIPMKYVQINQWSLEHSLLKSLKEITYFVFKLRQKQPVLIQIQI